VRPRAVILGLVALGALGSSCKIYKNEGENLPPGYDALTYEAAPPRQVVDDGGLVAPGGSGGSGGGGNGGSGGAGGSGGSPVKADAAVARDAEQPPGLPDAGREAGGTCNLLMQDCGPNLGCYPGAAGVGRCASTDLGTPAGGQCFEPTNCAAGLTCADAICASLCDLAQPTCPGGARCVSLGATGVGFCTP
jgi:hypothetical protein